MTRAERQYVRVYHDDLMADYGASWSDDAQLATWLRLLVIADKMWPTVAELPRSVRAKPLAGLVAARLVELVPPHGYRIRGHDAERRKRQESARTAAASRWDSGRTPDGTADGMPSPSPRPSRADSDIPPPPAKRGRRKDETNPRAEGTAPRQTGTDLRSNGHSIRQERAAEKRGGFEALGGIMAGVAARQAES